MFAEDPLKARLKTAPTVLLGLCAVVTRAYGDENAAEGALCKRASSGRAYGVVLGRRAL